jgi:hypothetical protein
MMPSTPNWRGGGRPAVDLVAFEKDKIGAVRTDFILSAEIIAITLGTVAGAPLTQQVIVLSGIAIVMTVGVYGLVAGIVKLDDLGLWLTQSPGRWPNASVADPARGAVHDERPVGDRHGGDVSRRWRHPDPRHAGGASLD